MSQKSEDRGMMKWAPFYSVMSEAEIRSSVDRKIINEKPDFSEDQINELEKSIIEAYNNESFVTITLYNKYKNIYVSGIISKLDSLNKQVFIDKKPYNFYDILEINFE